MNRDDHTIQDALMMALHAIIRDTLNLDRCPRCGEGGGYHLECWYRDRAYTDHMDERTKEEWDRIKIGGTD